MNKTLRDIRYWFWKRIRKKRKAPVLDEPCPAVELDMTLYYKVIKWQREQRRNVL